MHRASSRYGAPTAKPLWEAPLDGQPGSDLYGSPVVWRNTVYIGVAGGFGEHFDADVRVRGNVVAVDARTGRMRWKSYTVPEGSDGGAVWTTPAIDPRAGRLYVGTSNAYHPPAWTTTDAIVAMRASDGALVGHHQATGGDVYTHLGAQGPDLDFGSSPNLFRLGVRAGLWWVSFRNPGCTGRATHGR